MTRDLGELSGWFGAEIELCVVSVGVETETVLADDLTKGEHVDDEEEAEFPMVTDCFLFER